MTGDTERVRATDGGPCENTDREIWRERPGDFYADSIFVTQGNGIGINCGGSVIVRPVRDWFKSSEAVWQGDVIRSQRAEIERLLSLVRGQGKEPQIVAWGVKDFADGWIIFHTEKAARKYADAQGCGQIVRALALTEQDLADRERGERKR